MQGNQRFINWRKDGKLPDIDLDIIFFSVEKGFSEFKIEELRKKYPNAKIAGYVKETWLPHQKFFSFDNSRYLGRIEHLKQCPYNIRTVHTKPDTNSKKWKDFMSSLTGRLKQKKESEWFIN